MASPKPLPPLHANTLRYKNMKRLQHDGGRAWIKDSQLHSAVRDADLVLQIQPSAKAKEA